MSAEPSAESESLLTDEMRAAVGRDFRWMRSFPIAASDIRKWAIAIYHPELPPAPCWDEEAAAASRFGGLVALEDFNPFAWMTAEPRADEGRRAGRPWPEPELGLPLPPTRANIISGMEVDYTPVRMRPGDVISSTTRLASYHERRGRLGLMLFTTTEERWINQDGELIRTSRIILIRYR